MLRHYHMKTVVTHHSCRNQLSTYYLIEMLSTQNCFEIKRDFYFEFSLKKIAKHKRPENGELRGEIR